MLGGNRFRKQTLESSRVDTLLIKPHTRASQIMGSIDRQSKSDLSICPTYSVLLEGYDWQSHR